jgi:hypothetical protein
MTSSIMAALRTVRVIGPRVSRVGVDGNSSNVRRAPPDRGRSGTAVVSGAAFRASSADRPVCPSLPTSCCIATNRRWGQNQKISADEHRGRQAITLSLGLCAIKSRSISFAGLGALNK